MELTLVNELEHTDFETYETDFLYIAQKTLEKTQKSSDVVFSVILVDDVRIHEINREYRGIDRPTDVITFALLDDKDEYESGMQEELETELGDVFINRDAVFRQAEEYGHSVRREMCFLFTHGLLHLLGYDHMNEQDEREMFGLQKEILDDYIPR
ncbi:MAG: rRNA maturation RNase YbeY [Erysipelotrichaceae bacterium]|nr:rRNA maturation RNase YbeY [Erysipelotrichaceae bacterium]